MIAKARVKTTRFDTDLETQVWRNQYHMILEERDALKAQLRQLRRQQAALAEKAARLRLQIAVRDKSRIDKDDTDWR
jgi:cell division protein FtsB